MQFPWHGLQGFSGATAIGSIVLIGGIFLVNAFAENLLPAIQIFASTPTWALVTAIPLVALAYLIGLLSIGAGEAILHGLRLTNRTTIISDAMKISTKNGLIVERYFLLIQEANILAGSSLSFACLSFSAAFSAWKIEGWRGLLTTTSSVALLLSFYSILLSTLRHRFAHQLAVSSEEKSSIIISDSNRAVRTQLNPSDKDKKRFGT
jgi:hypothetical protein